MWLVTNWLEYLSVFLFFHHCILMHCFILPSAWFLCNIKELECVQQFYWKILYIWESSASVHVSLNTQIYFKLKWLWIEVWFQGWGGKVHFNLWITISAVYQGRKSLFFFKCFFLEKKKFFLKRWGVQGCERTRAIQKIFWYLVLLFLNCFAAVRW